MCLLYCSYGAECPEVKVGHKPRRVKKVASCFDKLISHHRQGALVWCVQKTSGCQGKSRTERWSWDGATTTLRQEHEARSRKQQGRGSRSRSSTPCSSAQARAQPFYWGPPACPLLFPPHPSFWNLFLSSYLQPPTIFPTSVHLSTRPFFDFEKQSVKMGYTKTDELAINTIRVLAVSHSILKQSKHSCHGTRQRPACPSIAVAATAVDSLFHHPKSATTTPQYDQLCSQIFCVGRCDRPCQLWPPWCAYVRCSLPLASPRLTRPHSNVGDRGVMRAIKRTVNHADKALNTGAWHPLPTFSTASS